MENGTQESTCSLLIIANLIQVSSTQFGQKFQVSIRVSILSSWIMDSFVLNQTIVLNGNNHLSYLYKQNLLNSLRSAKLIIKLKILQNGLQQIQLGFSTRKTVKRRSSIPMILKNQQKAIKQKKRSNPLNLLNLFLKQLLRLPPLLLLQMQLLKNTQTESVKLVLK